MANLTQPVHDVPGLHTLQAISAGAILASTFERDDGEVVWRDSHHRLVLPLTDANVRRVTTSVDGERAREFVWGEGLGFYPAGTRTRTVTAAAKSVQLLWRADAKADGRFEPLLPFEDPLIALNTRMIARELDGGAPDGLFVESLGTTVLIKLRRQFGVPMAAKTSSSSGLSRERLQRVIDYIDSHLGERLTLDSIAAVACLSPHHLSRSFHRAMGVGLHRYVVQRRIGRARQLVLKTDLPMAQIAWKVGFESQAAFTTRFRQEFGRPPSQLRRDG